MSEKKKPRVGTFSKVMSLEEAEREKQKDTTLGKSLRNADTEYEERKRRKK